MPPLQDDVYTRSIKDPESFWSEQAEQIHWHKKPSKAYDKKTKTLKSGTKHAHWSWFPDGEVSTTYNCVDRHVKNGNGDRIAICWDSPVTKVKQDFTYKQLLEEVETLAGVLREEGVKKGDVVLIYMPMIPAALFAMLAIARLGAIHAVVFGGFSPAALAQRMEASRPRAIMTASCGIEGAKKPTGYKKLIEEAIQKSSFKPQKTIVWQRDELRWDPVLKEDGQRNWQRLVKSARNRGLKADCVPIKSGDGLYIIYTSGTTGLPKGVVREAGGHAVGLNLSIKYLFGVHGPGDVMFTASDIGWVVGHSYIVYAPLLAGATTVLFEGKPIGTPDAGTFWRIIEEYKVTTMFTAPTALRAIRNADGDNDFFEDRGKAGGLKTLRALFLAGERSEPSIVQLYQKLLAKHCANGATVIDNWWSSESGSPISGIALSAGAADGKTSNSPKPLSIKPGSAGKAMPGFDVRVVDDQGKEVKRGSMGNIVMGIPLAPTAFTTLWEDEERFYRGYLKRFDGNWVDTGDAGMMDEEGYISIMSRADDIINVAAHRFSTGAIEQAVTSHPDIGEAAVVGIPDALKGHLPFAFITLSTHSHPHHAVPDNELFKEVQKLVREQIGAIANLGGMIQGKGMIPKTRSGKTLRRVLRELLENATHGEFDKEVQIPSTIEDKDVVEVARAKIHEYFEKKGKDLHKATEVRAKL
ncbi:hypothetical protein BDV96DRAFT_599537 [Lophiotrema nucula]|uniref:Acetyl-CoA synthetase-like protein n=1 Tax=Lophiotrema nucula TaxID=690887 RepID=A0A6A5Z7L7_9PLEO|nr:hypothetical protein BDV96DRAFT_599537 [Lophiotrema nucula]